MNIEGTRFGRRELLQAGFCALVLLWVNAYICRGLFFTQTAYMNSMHGFWIAIAQERRWQLVSSVLVALLGCRYSV